MSTEAIEKLKDYKKKVTPEDKIMALFSKIGSETINKNHGKIQKALYKLKSNPEYEAYFEAFTFNTSGLIPYSKLLENTLNRLETFSIFATLNPTYNTYKINHEHAAKSYNKLDYAEKRLVDKISNDMTELI